MPFFHHRGVKIHYHESGSGPTVVYLHGLLHRNWMQNRLFDLASKRFRAVAMEFSGHGESDAPKDPSHYSLLEFASEVDALLRHVEVESAVVHGTSLGANVVLEMLVSYPTRLAGAVVEMPVLAGGYPFARVIFAPLAMALNATAPLVSAVASALSRIPRSNPNLGVFLDIVPKDPRQAASVLRGLLESTPRPDLSCFRGIDVPTLVIGHPRDPLHSFEDAKRLVEALPNGRLLVAKSMLELRLNPCRLWPEIESFYDSCLPQFSDTSAG
ncbi:MAG: alpha/beta hydrolase [Acidimicrobiia bacterium]